METRGSAWLDVYKRQSVNLSVLSYVKNGGIIVRTQVKEKNAMDITCLLYTSMTGRFLAIGCLLVPVVLLVVLYGRKSLKGMWGYLASVSICMGASMLLVTNFIGAELADLITGVVGVAASVAYLKLVGVKENEAYVNESDATFETSLTNFKAFLPYILLLILLPAVRFSFPLSALTKYGYATWIGAVIHLVVLIKMCIRDRSTVKAGI